MDYGLQLSRRNYNSYVVIHITWLWPYHCEPNKRNNTRKREIRLIGEENTLFYQTHIDENNFLKMFISVTKFPTKYKLLLAYMHINNNC